MNPKYICIEGNIGAGKTTLAKLLAQETNARLVLEEFEHNAFLAKFYQNPERYAFPLEMSFLADRYHQLKKELSVRDLFQPLLIADYTINKSLIFAQNNLRDIEYKLYREFFNITFRQLPRPDLIIYLNRPVESLHSNIVKRGRDYEQQIKVDYLQEIDDRYKTFMRQNDFSKVLIINADEYDFIKNKADLKEIQKRVFQLFE